MEHNSSFDSFELQFTQQAQSFYRETSKWATFLSIIGFLGSGLMIIVGLAMFAMGNFLASGMASNPMAGMFSGGLLGGFYLLFAIINFFPAYYMNKFASKAREALDGSNTTTLNQSFENLKSYFKFTGVAVIVVISLYVLLIIGFVIVGMGAAGRM